MNNGCNVTRTRWRFTSPIISSSLRASWQRRKSASVRSDDACAFDARAAADNPARSVAAFSNTCCNSATALLSDARAKAIAAAMLLSASASADRKLFRPTHTFVRSCLPKQRESSFMTIDIQIQDEWGYSSQFFWFSPKPKPSILTFKTQSLNFDLSCAAVHCSFSDLVLQVQSTIKNSWNGGNPCLR